MAKSIVKKPMKKPTLQLAKSKRKKALLLLAHGSKTPETLAEIQALSKAVAKSQNYTVVHFAFLTLQTPNLVEALTLLVKAGHYQVGVLPLFLFSGMHVIHDIPQALEKAIIQFPTLELTLFPHIGSHPDFVELIAQKIS